MRVSVIRPGDLGKAELTRWRAIQQADPAFDNPFLSPEFTRIVGELREVRKHAGLMVAGPVQEAMVAALGDDDHVAEQRSRYRDRRTALRIALEAAGFRIDHSEASLYLWATRDEPCRETLDWLAERGILVAPGEFYGAAGGRHVRFALTATDERIATAVARLAPR